MQNKKARFNTLYSNNLKKHMIPSIFYDLYKDNVIKQGGIKIIFELIKKKLKMKKYDTFQINFFTQEF